jgi:two-component system OmpR family sensor kinase
MVCCGIRSGKPVLRRVGLALLALTAAPMFSSVPSLTASALGLAGVAMLLAAAVPFAVGALRTVWRELADSQARLHAAETAMAHSAVRDHEMRNLVAGLSGAESVLAAQEVDEESPEGRKHLRAAARAELERLRRMLDNEEAKSSEPSSVRVAPLLSDLAALHGAAGAAIELNVANDLQALMPPECLAHIVTNLLVNCARHAPGARVWLTASRRADQVVIEVVDDGPGLPPNLIAELLEPGVRGPSSTGTGLGLHVSAELAGRHGGAIRLVPTPGGGPGCTVVVELPAAATGSQRLEQVTV